MENKELTVVCHIHNESFGFRIYNNTDSDIKTTKINISNAETDVIILTIQSVIQIIEAKKSIGSKNVMEIRTFLNLYNLPNTSKLKVVVITSNSIFESEGISFR